jgi:hypothetical protein
MFTLKIMPPKCRPLTSLWCVLYTQVENYIQKFLNCLVYIDVNHKLPSGESCTKHTHTLLGNKLQARFHSSMTEYALYVAKLVTSHEVCSIVNPVRKKTSLQNFPRSQIQAQQAFTHSSEKSGPQGYFRAKMAAIKH